MGNSVLPLSRFRYRDRSRYSQLDKKTKEQQWLEDSQVQEWDISWKDVTHENIYYRIEYGKFHTFRNEITFEEIEKYQIVLNDKNDFEKWKEMVHWRNNCQYLTKIQHFSLLNKGEICVSQFQVNLFAERIPLRLADLTDIPYPENLYFLLSVVKGFKYIFSSPFAFKSFKVTESMICVNKDGEVKVWLNPNLSQFQPINSKNNTYITQQDILRSLIDLVEQNTDQKDYPYPFRQYLNDKNILINGEYNTIIQQLYSYAKDMKVIIPKYAFSVRDILTKDLFHGTKMESENSYSNKFNFRNQNAELRKDTSMSVINSLEFQGNKKNLVYFDKEGSKGELFPKDKTHGLLSTQKVEKNLNAPIVPELPSFSVNQPQTESYTFVNAPIKNGANLSQNEAKLISEVRPPFTDRNFYNENMNGHLMRINKIGNNIIQFHPQPDFTYRYNPIQPGPFPTTQNHIQNIERKQFHSLENPMSQKRTNTPSPAYKMVERKIIHPLNFNHLQNQKPPSFHPQFHPQYYPNQHCSSQIPHSHYFSNIQRVNSTRIPFSQPGGQNIPRSYSIQKASMIPLTSTVRPEQISNKVQIQRIGRQASQKTFSNHQTHEQMRKTNSFKNNLIKSQHEQNQGEKTVSNLKYFTKKDSEQTLDPEIAGDLMKYLNHQV